MDEIDTCIMFIHPFICFCCMEHFEVVRSEIFLCVLLNSVFKKCLNRPVNAQRISIMQ